ncbi:MAG TPA: T9SS type A sorting domain-containing protein [Rubricoccaceae bacterium]|nr:T9SS type A sorting domain-containing protein [Rubricoccaceae bacterium]
MPPVREDLWVPGARTWTALALGDALYLGGDFDVVGPPTGVAARVDGTTGVPDLNQARVELTDVTPTGGVLAIEPDGEGGWYVAGLFRRVGGQPRLNLAHLLAGGTLDPAFDVPIAYPAAGSDIGFVRALLLDPARGPNGVLYVGGSFTLASGQPRQDLVALDAATGAVLPLQITADEFTGTGSGVMDLALSGNMLVVASSGYERINGQPHSGLFALDVVSGALIAWDPAAGPYVNHIELGPSSVFAEFTHQENPPNGPFSNRLREFRLSDGGTTAWNPDAGLPQGFAYVYDMLAHDGQLYLAGIFGPISQSEGARRVDMTTAQVAPFAQSANIHEGRALAREGSRLWIAGREVTAAPGEFIHRNFVRAVGLPSGQREGPEIQAAHDTAPYFLNALAAAYGDVFIGGDAVTIGAEERPFIAGLDLGTGRPGVFMGDYRGSVLDIEVAPNDLTKLYVAGVGISLGAYRQGITELHLPGGQVTSTDFGFYPVVLSGGLSIAVTDERVYACGHFINLNDGTGEEVPRRYLAAWDRHTGALLEWAPGITTAIGVYGEPDCWVVDDMLVVNVQAYNYQTGEYVGDYVNAFDLQTGEHVPWDPDLNSILYGVDWEGDLVYLYGGFETVGGQPHPGLAAVDVETAAVTAWAPDLTAAGFPPENRGYAFGVYGRAAYLDARSAVDQRIGLVAFDTETGAQIPWFGEYQRTGFTPASYALTLAPTRNEVYVVGDFQSDATGQAHANLAGFRVPTGYEIPVGAEPPALPERSGLVGLYPNPFVEQARLVLRLAGPERVEVGLYDLLGRRVAVLHDGVLPAGETALPLAARGLPAGTYVARVQGETFSATQRATVVR